MTDFSTAKIFLADERGLSETNTSRSFHTFNFGSFFNQHKTPFSDLYALNDESFAGSAVSQFTVDMDACILLLPIVGAINYKDTIGNESLINSGEIQMIFLPAASEVTISNPYEDELVNYLQLWFKSPVMKAASKPLVVDFDLVAHKNHLVEVTRTPFNTNPRLRMSVGQFMGREEAVYRLVEKKNGLFIFVIEGAFEVQGRLLHPRDGLALWDVEDMVELEALSNEAIVIVLEIC